MKQKDQNNTIKSTVKICYDIDKENFNELCIKLKDQFKYEIAYALTKLDINNPSVKIIDKALIKHNTSYDDNKFYVITNKRKLKIESLFVKYIDKTYKFNFDF